MSDDVRAPSSDDVAAGNDLARLLRLAGPREPAPADRAARVRTSVRAEWQQAVSVRRRRVRVAWSAGVLATAALLLLYVRPTGPETAGAPAAVATIDAVDGDVTVTPGEGGSPAGATAPGTASPGDRLPPGSRIATSETARVRLRLSNGARMHVNRATRVRFISPTALALDRGAVFIAGGPDAQGALEVRTPFGTARDIGTEFEVHVDGGAATVRVREGRVRVERDGASHDAGPSDELVIEGSGRVQRRTIPSSGWTWAWALPEPSRFEIEGRSLNEFLDWLCRENAWRLVWADATVERHAARTILHGSIEGLTAQDALAAVLPASGVEHRLDDGVLSVERAPDAAEAAR